MAAEDDSPECPDCHRPMEQDWLPRVRHNAQWDDNTAVMVHVDPATGDVRYPGQHSAKLKEGYERVYLRSLAEVNAFERKHNVATHVMHYDNNGRALDDRMA
jgi:hypothetical protein